MGLPFPRADSSVYGPLGEIDGEFAATQGAIDNTTSAGSSLIRQPRLDRHAAGLYAHGRHIPFVAVHCAPVKRDIAPPIRRVPVPRPLRQLRIDKGSVKG